MTNDPLPNLAPDRPDRPLANLRAAEQSVDDRARAAEWAALWANLRKQASDWAEAAGQRLSLPAVLVCLLVCLTVYNVILLDKISVEANREYCVAARVEARLGLIGGDPVAGGFITFRDLFRTQWDACATAEGSRLPPTIDKIKRNR